MKISIWRQFSSNHSGGFTVIGKFQSKEEADKLADEIRTLIKTIKEDTSSISPVIGEDDTYLTSNPPTEKEIAIATHGNKRGHPILFGRKFISEITGYPGEASLRDLLQKHPSEILEIKTGNGRILRDIDTENDYQFELKHHHKHD